MLGYRRSKRSRALPLRHKPLAQMSQDSLATSTQHCTHLRELENILVP